jgi:hypothetical protein
MMEMAKINIEILLLFYMYFAVYLAGYFIP